MMSQPVMIVYLSIIFLGVLIFILFKKSTINQVQLKKFIISIMIGIFCTIVSSIPRYLNNDFSLSFSNKSIFESRGLTWTEWVYHSQLMGNEKRYGFFTIMDTWESALSYKIKNGDESLPDSYFEYLYFDFSFLLRRIFTSIIEVSIISIRYIGYLLFVLPLYLYFKLKAKIIDSNLLMSIIALSGIFTWIIIWPGLIQHRWLYPFYVIIIFVLNEKTFFESGNYKKIMIPNLLLVNLIITWFLWKENFFSGI